MSEITLHIILYIISLVILTAFARNTHISDGGSDWIVMAILAFIPLVNLVFAGLLVIGFVFVCIFMLFTKLNDNFKQRKYVYSTIGKLFTMIYGTHKG